MASLVQACICNGHSRLESLSESSDACRALKKSSLLQQAKRWLSNKWTDWQTFYLPFVRKPSANNTLFFRLLFRSIARSSFLQARLNLERCFFNRGVTQSYLSLRNSAVKRTQTHLEPSKTRGVKPGLLTQAVQVLLHQRGFGDPRRTSCTRSKKI